MIVLDFSIVIDILPWTGTAERIYGRVLDPTETRHSPYILDVEAAQVVRRYRLAGAVEAPPLAALMSLPILSPYVTEAVKEQDYLN